MKCRWVKGRIEAGENAGNSCGEEIFASTIIHIYYESRVEGSSLWPDAPTE
jgi:hypothetical protein